MDREGAQRTTSLPHTSFSWGYVTEGSAHHAARLACKEPPFELFDQFGEGNSVAALVIAIMSRPFEAGCPREFSSTSLTPNVCSLSLHR